MVAHSQDGGQVAVLGPGVPERRTFRQPQLGPPPPGLPLLAGQPFPERRDQVVVGQLVILPPRLAGRASSSSPIAFGVGRGDQAQLGVEDAEQVVEVPGAVGIARCVQQLLVRPHLALDVGAALREQGLQDRLGGLLVEAVFGRSRRALKVSSRKVTPTPSVPPTAFKVAGVQGFPLTISANRASRTEMTRPSWDEPRTAWSRKVFWSLVRVGRLLGQAAVGPAEHRQDLPGVDRVEQVDRGRRSGPATSSDLQLAQEPGQGQPEIVPHHDDALDVLAVALPQGLGQFGVLLLPLGVQPLLELVEDEQ